MLSILIPVFQFDIRQLVSELQRQCLRQGITFEILCFDDGSDIHWRLVNRPVGDWAGVIYQEMPENLGRSKIRNRLGQGARYDYLLFLDCDSGVIRPDYIPVYLARLNPDILLYGGRTYQEVAPVRKELYLHWRYGRKREEVSWKERQRNPHHAFMTNNFLIPRALFSAIRFDERLAGYGHEDTLFGMELQRRKIPVHHLDNPLEHLGLEPADVFLRKSEQAVHNLYFLFRQGVPVQTRLLSVFRRLLQGHLGQPVHFLLQTGRPFFRRNLLSSHPRLFFFDLYKLSILLACHFGEKGRVL